jgi:hypothetical protein
MALKDLKSIHDLVQGDGPVNDMAKQTGPNFPIVGPGVTTGAYPFSVPNGSQLHGGPLENQSGASLVGPAYQGIYGGVSQPSNLDNPLTNGNSTPPQYLNNLPD